MLILASLSGIQDFLFDVRESGGKQARALRHRSFRIQLIAECVALRLLDATGLGRDRLLFCAAAKLAIDAHGLSETTIDSVRRAAAEMTEGLLQEAHGRLRLSVVLQSASDGFASSFEQAERAMRCAKLRAFAPASGTWGDDALVVRRPWDADREAERDAKVGRDLVNACWLTISRSMGPAADDDLDMLGLRVRLLRNEPAYSPALLSCSNLVKPESAPTALDGRFFHVRRLARHIPRDEQGDAIEFLDLAACCRGAPMLGVLKADGDSLGAAVATALHSGKVTAPLRALSSALDHFFAEMLEAEKAKLGSPWSQIYTVFSGGDDMLAVGPWDVMVDFAGHMRGLFERIFGCAVGNSPSPIPLTISAGVAIIKPRYPIHLAAQQAEELLDQAKVHPAPGARAPKDQCAALGQVWKWADHATIIDAGKRLVGWIDTGVIQRGWLHTVLSLALLRRGEAGPDQANLHPAMATSRLAHHVARNWPRRNAGDESARAARQWIDSIVEHFDANPIDAPILVRHLPVVIRYAILATRSGGRED